MLLSVAHETHFSYDHPVVESHLEFRQTPVTDATQQLLQHRYHCSPARPMRQYIDYWGNTVTYLNIVPEHERIEATFESVVQTQQSRFRGFVTPPAERGGPVERRHLHDFLQPTVLAPWSEPLREFVAPFEGLRGGPVLEAAETLRETIHHRFRYDGDVTSVHSTADDVLHEGAGVCQDFTHLMLAACRYLGIAARYVSGYVLPERLEEEALASHAWCEVYDPSHGWFGLDPTHNQWVEERHVRLGVGRDYADVPPNRGLFRGAATESLAVRVRVTPLAEDDLAALSRTLQPAQRASDYATRQRRPPPSTSSLMQQSLLAQQQQQQ